MSGAPRRTRAQPWPVRIVASQARGATRALCRQQKSTACACHALAATGIIWRLRSPKIMPDADGVRRCAPLKPLGHTKAKESWISPVTLRDMAGVSRRRVLYTILMASVGVGCIVGGILIKVPQEHEPSREPPIGALGEAYGDLLALLFGWLLIVVGVLLLIGLLASLISRARGQRAERRAVGPENPLPEARAHLRRTGSEEASRGSTRSDRTRLG